MFLYVFVGEHKDQDVKFEQEEDQEQFMNVAADTDNKATSVP